MLAKPTQTAPMSLPSVYGRRSLVSCLALLAVVGLTMLAGAPKSAAALYHCAGVTAAADTSVGADGDWSSDEATCPMAFGPTVQGSNSASSAAALGWVRGTGEAGASAENAATWIAVYGQGHGYLNVDMRLEGPAGATAELPANCAFAFDLTATGPAGSPGGSSEAEITSVCTLRNVTRGEDVGVSGVFRATAWNGSGPGWGGVQYRGEGDMYPDLDPAMDLGCTGGAYSGLGFVSCSSSRQAPLPPLQAAVGDTLRIGLMAAGSAYKTQRHSIDATPATTDHTVAIAIDLPPGFHLAILDTCDAAGENCETVDGNFQPLPACSNGLDDDGDGAVDFVGGDTGCNSPDDPTESNPPRCGLLGLESLMALIPLARRVRRAQASAERAVDRA